MEIFTRIILEFLGMVSWGSLISKAWGSCDQIHQGLSFRFRPWNEASEFTPENGLDWKTIRLPFGGLWGPIFRGENVSFGKGRLLEKHLGLSVDNYIYVYMNLSGEKIIWKSWIIWWRKTYIYQPFKRIHPGRWTIFDPLRPVTPKRRTQRFGWVARVGCRVHRVMTAAMGSSGSGGSPRRWSMDERCEFLV